MAPLIVFPFILFGGLVSNNKAQLAWLSWIQYISPIKYCAEALLSNEFANDPNNIS
jgi:ABC-type multidrug transport system permease subunit